jgi:REase_DpnII-MboI
MKIFNHDFQMLDSSHIEDLLQLQREAAIYTDHWFDELDDFRHIKIRFTENEVKEYVRSLWAYELFLRADSPPLASSVARIPRDIAKRTDSYTLRTVDSDEEITPWHCPAAFLGPELEELVCQNVPGRYVILEELGTDSLFSTLRKAVDALTPSIRLFRNREKGLAQWSVDREDDIRDLLYVILRASISDVTREEAIPSRAGTHRFVDLCSNTARLLIEIKWIDKKGSWKRIIKEINDDTQSYIRHPACENLVFIVIDAAKDIPDPLKFEKDLSGAQEIEGKAVQVTVFIREP